MNCKTHDGAGAFLIKCVFLLVFHLFLKSSSTNLDETLKMCNLSINYYY